MEKILIVKLGAKGDVIRTLSVLPALREKFPNSQIHWVTKPGNADLIKTHPEITKVHTTPCILENQFDTLYNFDIEPEATDIAQKTRAHEKFGFYSEGSYPASYNPEAEYYLNTVFDDELKKTNRKTYQEMMFSLAKLSYNKQSATIHLTEKEKEFGKNFIVTHNLKGKKIIGIHMGTGPRWPSKAWAKEKVETFIIKARDKGYEIILFGGPDEAEKHTALVQALRKKNIMVHQNNPQNTDREFAALVNICETIVCSDSFALHVALGLNKQTIGLFFCSTPYEIESYGKLQKIISPLFENFFPEKMDQYSEELVNSISVERVLKLL